MRSDNQRLVVDLRTHTRESDCGLPWRTGLHHSRLIVVDLTFFPVRKQHVQILTKVIPSNIDRNNITFYYIQEKDREESISNQNNDVASPAERENARELIAYSNNL